MKNTHRGNTRNLLINLPDRDATTQTFEKGAACASNGHPNRTATGGTKMAVETIPITIPSIIRLDGISKSTDTRTSTGAGRSRTKETRRDSDALGRAGFGNWPESVFILDPYGWGLAGPAVECNGVEWEQGGSMRRYAWTLEWPIVDCNAAACRRHGYLRSELVGHPVGALGPLASDPAVLMNLLPDLASRDIVRFEALHRGKDGACFPVETSVSRVRLGARDLIIMLCRDAAQNVKTSQTAQREEETRNLERWESIGRLAGGVAHDFNNVLTEIRRCADAIHGSPNGSLGLAPQLKQLVVTAERATTLTWQLLAFSRKQASSPELLDLNKLVGGVMEMLQHVLRPDIEVVLKLAHGLPAIPAHGSMLEQVLMNLAINSRYAMPRGGRLVIETRIAEIDAAYIREHPDARIGRHACLWMSDTGGGVNPTRIGCIHEPFFTTRNVGQGTGLGLATVNGIVKQHQGWIDVNPAIGVGTRFGVYLPVSPPKLDPFATDRPHHPISGGTETILLAECDLLMRALARSILERYGYQVIEAGSIAEVRKAWECEGAQIRLMLTEMGTAGGMNGRDLAGQLIAKHPGLKVLYTSACSAALTQSDYPLKPGINFLPKPYSATALAQAVRNCLDRESPA